MTSKPPPPAQARSWEHEVQMTETQLIALQRGASVKAATTSGLIVVLLPPKEVEA